MSTEQPSIEELKTSLDIITIAEMYGELIKTGANYKFKDDTSIVINPSEQFFKNFSDSDASAKGSVLDLICYMEKCDLATGIKKLKELNGVDTYHVKPEVQVKRKEEATKKKTVDFRKLGLFAKNDLAAGQGKKPYELDIDGVLSLSINPIYHKLFERETFPIDNKTKIDYLYSKIIGYDEYYQCTSIIIRDATGKVVDKCAYRPIKPANYDNWIDPKYIYKNSHNRGDNFIYPFQSEVEKIIKREKYFIVGEGIKNAVNALLYSAPFISMESTSNQINQKLLDYIIELKDRGFGVVCMFDGDKAGLKAYNQFKEQSGLDAINHLDFKSNIDFTEYMVGA
jgi:hypothetical protein